MTSPKTLIGHPAGLFVLFFTEMWERFSYYGMRAILVLFLVSTASEGGFNWSRADALTLYGIYTGLVYLTPIFGGILADKFWGFRKAVVIGAGLMTAGHAAMAFETEFTFYLGLALLVLGNGAFKPNISSMVGQLYPEGSGKKDSAYTIFYMGINAGAFLGILICGYLGEQVGWSYGFGAAGIFMLFGLLQFQFAQKLFGSIGEKPQKSTEHDSLDAEIVQEAQIDLDPMDKTPAKIERDRLIVIGVLAFFTIFFWMAFEQAGGTMTVFAADYTDRSLDTDLAVNSFRWISFAFTIIPIVILSIVLFGLAKQLFAQYPLTIIFTLLSFLIIWGVMVFINKSNFESDTLEVPASWFSTLNSFFIISLAPLFSKLWERLAKNGGGPSGPVKFAIGLILLGLGFGALSFGAAPIEQGAQTASVSMIWLCLAYFLHTLGELCVSPVGLSFVNKLSPKRLLGMMFGIWFLANFVANTLAGISGSFIDRISEASSLSGFFSIFLFSSIGAALILLILNKKLVRMMHGVN